jgi:hypothetical protein
LTKPMAARKGLNGRDAAGDCDWIWHFIPLTDMRRTRKTALSFPVRYTQ